MNTKCVCSVTGNSDSWQQFTKLCAKISKHSKHTDKIACIKEFFEGEKFCDRIFDEDQYCLDPRYDGDLYLLFKMLLPSVDQRVYQMKDKALIKLFSNVR
jgi:hypothetical protein